MDHAFVAASILRQIDPVTVEVCHYRDWQVLASSAFRIVVPALEGSFRLLSGTPTIYVKVVESGNRRDLAFCLPHLRHRHLLSARR